MTKITIPFNNWSRERLRNNTKTATSRNKRYGIVGDTFVVDGVTYKLTSIARLRLGYIAEQKYAQEGAKSPEEFINVWNEIHPRKKYNPVQKVYYHEFERM